MSKKKCDNKIIDIIRSLDTIGTTLITCTKGQILVIEGNDCVALRVEGVKHIYRNLRNCADMLQEVITEDESGTQDS